MHYLEAIPQERKNKSLATFLFVYAALLKSYEKKEEKFSLDLFVKDNNFSTKKILLSAHLVAMAVLPSKRSLLLDYLGNDFFPHESGFMPKFLYDFFSENSITVIDNHIRLSNYWTFFLNDIFSCSLEDIKQFIIREYSLEKDSDFIEVTDLIQSGLNHIEENKLTGFIYFKEETLSYWSQAGIVYSSTRSAYNDIIQIIEQTSDPKKLDQYQRELVTFFHYCTALLLESTSRME